MIGNYESIRLRRASLRQIETFLRGLDPDFEHDVTGFECAVVLLAARQLGTELELLRSFTSYPMPLLNQISDRMRGSGLWIGDEAVTDHWFRSDGFSLILFLADVLVARGLLEAMPDKQGTYVLWIPEHPC